MSVPLLDLRPLVDLDPAANPELGASLAASDHPMALLPVRLETRFTEILGGGVELWVRVYPDKIHLDAHDPRLTAGEVETGRQYWQTQWRAGSDETRLRQAWRMMADRSGPGRAAWIARRLQPVNSDERPDETVDLDTPLPRQPQFPDPGEQTERTATPQARLLPDRWIVCAYRNGALLALGTSGPVAPKLAVGPDPDAPLLDAPDGPDLDRGMAWMVDFDEAEQAGMAVRLPLPGSFADAAVDVLLVSGVRTADAATGAGAYADLLAAQRFTDGLAFLPLGTPSNNSDVERAGYVSRDLRGDRSFATEWSAPAVAAGGPTDAGRAAAAFGLEAPGIELALRHVEGAAATQDALAAAMQTALWPVTWGYFLTQFIGIGPPRLSLADYEWVRRLARSYLRPAGPLPALRIGRQPYGILPVTSLTRWAGTGPDATRFERLRQLLVALREQVWRPAVADVARVGRGADPNADLVHVLQSDALTPSFWIRKGMGPQYLQHLRLFLGEDLEALGFWTRVQQLSRRLPRGLGLGFQPRSGGMVFESNPRQLSVPLVNDDLSAAIGGLLGTQNVADLAAAPASPPGSLLEALLRHGLLREHAQAAARLLSGPEGPVETLLREAEFVDLGPGADPTPTWAWQLGQPLPGSAPVQTVEEHLAGLTDFGATEVRSLGEFRASLEMLAEQGAAVLEPALIHGLGTTSHRLDAWATAVATARLDELRTAQPIGLLIGGYGWLENLRPEPRTPIDPRVDEPGPLFAAIDDPGFIHAPSIGQATAGALLRNAHLAHGATEDSPYAIQLTSDRVRRAEQLFDGIRQGQTLGALLGYGVERRVHELHLDRYLDDLRRVAPPPDLNSGEDAVRQRVMLDGLALQRRWSANPEAVLHEIPALNQTDRPRLIAVLDQLDSAVDAAADAVTAENVFQFARGNLTRSSGSLDEIASGRTPPPQLEFMRTPRTGTAIIHRVVVAIEADRRDAPNGWAQTTPRAVAEPVLDAWAARLLGPAAGVNLFVEVLGPDGAASPRQAVPLSDLGLGALDLIWISGDNAATTELARRAFVTLPIPVQPAGSGGPAVGEPRVRLDLTPDPDRRTRGIADLLEVARRIRALLAGARPLDGADLQPAHAEPDRRLDLDEFAARATAAQTALADSHRRLSNLLDPDQGASLGEVRAVLAELAGFGVPGAFAPLLGADGGRLDPGSVAVPAAAAVLAEVGRRLTDATRQAEEPPEESELARRERLLRQIQAVFGGGFLACPTFAAPTADQLAASVADPALLEEDRLAAYSWLQQMERVRPPLSRLGMVLREAEVLGRVGPFALTVAQVPHVPGCPWLGRVLSGEAEGQDGQVSLVLAGFDKPDLFQPLTGLLADEWVEVVPSRAETSGIAFRYDPPDAVAPQSILLAVPPVVGEPWTVGTLNQVLLETLELAHLRTVGPELLDQAGQFLPASLLAFNVDGDVPSTDPNTLDG